MTTCPTCPEYETIPNDTEIIEICLKKIEQTYFDSVILRRCPKDHKCRYGERKDATKMPVL